jgi:hypothetical protein
MTKRVQYCRCKINLAGQNCHTVIYGEHNPVTWPELQVLQLLHGDENVMDIVPVGIGEVWPTEEKNRLISIYGHRVVETCFPGRAFRMDYVMTDDVDLPTYEHGVMVAAAPPPREPVREPDQPPPPPPPKRNDDNFGDHDDGEDEDEDTTHSQADVAAIPPDMPPLEPIFKPGRNRRPRA